MKLYFNTKRFCQILTYDIRRNWPYLLKQIVSMAACYIFVCFIPGVISLLSGGSWIDIPETGRVVMAIAMIIIPTLCAPTNYYGFITDKFKGMTHMMIPGSKFEKTLSMFVNCLLVFPLAITATILASDLIITLILPGCGDCVFGSLSTLTNLCLNWSILNIDGITTNSGALGAINVCFDTINIILFTLLCAIIFKKNKIAMTILSFIGICIAMGAILGLTVNIIGVDNLEMWTIRLSERITEENAGNILRQIFFWDTLKDICITAGLSYGVYYRMSKIQY